MEDPDAEGEARFITLGMDTKGRVLVIVWTPRSTRHASCRPARQAEKRQSAMRNEYDFSKAKRGAVIASPGKTRITIMLDNDVLDAFRERAEAEGRGYQTAINNALRDAINADVAPVTVATLRKELKRALKDIAA
jgi:uncharacterized protein (DUF4415 family)